MSDIHLLTAVTQCCTTIINSLPFSGAKLLMEQSRIWLLIANTSLEATITNIPPLRTKKTEKFSYKKFKIILLTKRNSIWWLFPRPKVRSKALERVHGSAEPGIQLFLIPWHAVTSLHQTSHFVILTSLKTSLFIRDTTKPVHLTSF